MSFLLFFIAVFLFGNIPWFIAIANSFNFYLDFLLIKQVGDLWGEKSHWILFFSASLT